MQQARGWVMAHKLIVAAALVAMAGLGWWMWPKSTAQASNFARVQVVKGSIDEFVTAQGTLGPKEYVDVGTQVSGQLLKLHGDIGDDVNKGDLLAEIDPTVYQSKVDVDKANLNNITAQLKEQQAAEVQAKLVYQRNQVLVSSTAISRQDFEASEADYKSAAARVAAVKAQIDSAKSSLDGDLANLGYTKIYAPISGTIVSQSAREGQTVNASQSAPTIVKIANLDVMTVEAQVAEADVMRLSEGMPVYFTTLGSTTRKWNGTVRQILPTPENVNNVVLFDVLIDADNTDRQLMTGMSTQVFFEIGSAKDVPVIPLGALGKRAEDKDADGTQAYTVRVADGKNVKEQVVLIGRMSRTQAEVKSGLKIGDTVLTYSANASGKGQGSRGGGRMMGPRL
jgi:macrolide-specific efflux system membrane fusion protein